MLWKLKMWKKFFRVETIACISIVSLVGWIMVTIFSSAMGESAPDQDENSKTNKAEKDYYKYYTDAESKKFTKMIHQYRLRCQKNGKDCSKGYCDKEARRRYDLLPGNELGYSAIIHEESYPVAFTQSDEFPTRMKMFVMQCVPPSEKYHGFAEFYLGIAERAGKYYTVEKSHDNFIKINGGSNI